MSALELFKQAGIEEYLKPGLIGAGVGAAGMGLASLMGGDDNETSDQRRSRILSSVLQGGALGGLAGAGGSAAYNHFFKGDGLSDKAKQLQQGLADKGKQLDTKAFGVHHPIEQQLVNATHSDPRSAAAVGGIAGLGMNYNASRRARSLFEKAQEKIQGSATKDGKAAILDPAEKFKALATNQTSGSRSVRQRLVEQALQASGSNNVRALDLKDALVNQQLAGNNRAGIKDANRLINQARSASGKYNPGAGLPSGPFGIGDWLNSKSIMGRNVGALAAGGEGALTNAVGKTFGPFAMRNAMRYGKYGLAGAAGAVGAQQAARPLVDLYLRGKYEPEQLAYWSSFGQ